MRREHRGVTGMDDFCSILMIVDCIMWCGIGIYTIIKSRRLFRRMEALINNMERDIYKARMKR